MVLVPPCHLSSRRESPPSCRKKGKRYERRFVPLQPAGWLFGHQEFPFHSPLPPAPVHRLDINSSSGTSVFVSLLLSFFVCCSAYERKTCCSSFFENRFVLEIFGVGRNLTTLPYSLNISLSLSTHQPASIPANQTICVRRPSC